MSGENLWGVRARRIRAGLYDVEGWEVEDVKGTTGWRIRRAGHRDRWAETRSKAYGWCYESGRVLVRQED